MIQFKTTKIKPNNFGHSFCELKQNQIQPIWFILDFDLQEKEIFFTTSKYFAPPKLSRFYQDVSFGTSLRHGLWSRFALVPCTHLQIDCTRLGTLLATTSLASEREFEYSSFMPSNLRFYSLVILETNHLTFLIPNHKDV